MNDIGKRIKQKREEYGWTQEELAKRMGYKSKSTINKIEMGINDISQSKIVKFAEVLNTSVAYLMGWDQEQIDALSEMQKEADAYEDAIEQQIYDLIHGISQMSDEELEYRQEFIDLLINLYKLGLTSEELHDIYTYAQFVISKRKEG